MASVDLPLDLEEPDEVSEKVFAWKRSDDRYADAKRPVGEDDYCN